MIVQGKTITLTDSEERLQLAALANERIMKLEGKEKLTPPEQLQLQFARTLWESVKQVA